MPKRGDIYRASDIAFTDGSNPFTGPVLFTTAGSGFNASTITVGIGDSDTGFNWIKDGEFDVLANNKVVAKFTSSKITITAALDLSGNVIDNVLEMKGTKGSVINTNDAWLRINGAGTTPTHSSGVYFGNSLVRTDGDFHIGNAGATLLVNATTFTYRGWTVYHSGNFNPSTKADTARKVNPGAGLTGGGDLTADRTLTVNFLGTGSATTVARSDHNHDNTYVKNSGDTMTGPLTSTNTQPLISKLAGKKSWVLANTTTDADFVIAPSTAIDGTTWDWTKMVRFKDDGSLVAGSFYETGSNVPFKQKHKVTDDNGRSNLLTPGTNLNDVILTGFYRVNNPVNGPTNDSWFYVIVNAHDDNAFACMQIAYCLNTALTPHMYTRKRAGAVWTPWERHALLSDFGQWGFGTRDFLVHNKRAMVGYATADGDKLVLNFTKDFSNGIEMTGVTKFINGAVDLDIAGQTEYQIKGRSTVNHSGFYFKKDFLGAYDWEKSRQIWAYSRDANEVNFTTSGLKHNGNDVLNATHLADIFNRQTTMVTATTDWNTLLTTGFYQVNDGVKGANGPTPHAYAFGVLETVNTPGTGVFQRYTTHSKGDVYVRGGYNQNAGWNQWRKLTDTEDNLSGTYNVYRANKDANGIFTVVEWKEKSGTIRKRSTLSVPDANGNYTKQTIQIYTIAGALSKTENYTLSYDADGALVNEVLS